MMVSSVCLRLSYLYLPLDGLVSLAEVFFAGQLDNDASVLTALNNTKTHLSKHGPCFALTVFAAPLQFWMFFMFVTERRVALQRETELQFCVDKPPILSLLPTAVIEIHPISNLCHQDILCPPSFSTKLNCSSFSSRKPRSLRGFGCYLFNGPHSNHLGTN